MLYFALFFRCPPLSCRWAPIIWLGLLLFHAIVRYNQFGRLFGCEDDLSRRDPEGFTTKPHDIVIIPVCWPIIMARKLPADWVEQWTKFMFISKKYSKNNLTTKDYNLSSKCHTRADKFKNLNLASANFFPNVIFDWNIFSMVPFLWCWIGSEFHSGGHVSTQTGDCAIMFSFNKKIVKGLCDSHRNSYILFWDSLFCSGPKYLCIYDRQA